MKLNNIFKKKNINDGEVKQATPKKKLSKQAIWNIVCFCVLGLTHLAVIIAIILSFRYYSIYPSIFGSVVAIVICLLIIIDIVFFVGFNHKDIALKLISCILAGFIFIGGTVGVYFIAKANGIVDSVLDGSDSKYETFSGVLVCYDKNHKFSTLEELNGMTVGMLAETSNGVSYIAKNHLKDAKVDYGVIEYNTNAELVQALIDGDIDAMAITAAYRSIYSVERDENSPFAKYLENFVDFYTFEQELKTNSDRKTKNVTTDPFNVLLIGYSRTDIGSSIGLADSIIVATINPQTYTVSMMSIARDSFVPIPCYGGEYDKINSGRGTSRTCFIETVENFLGMEMDYYMELDYQGLVEIVDTIGGVKITNPVEFELDGIYVPEGTFNAGGWQALEFCRERHHMPNGDFDRQQHQKEVIIAIAKKFIESGDVSLALDALDNASDWMSTDLSLNQLTTIFNMLLNTKNYTSLDTFDLIDFQTLRMTGDGGIKYYSYSMHLPLWVYLIYQGSYDESMAHINDIMGNYSSINQDKSFGFSMQKQYVRPLFYSLTYPDVFMFTPDPMPDYWADLSGMTVAEAMAWASEKGVSLAIGETISAGDPRYNAEMEGLVFDQSVRYGSLVSENKSGTITVMGNGSIDEDKLVPNFVGHGYQKAIDWANDHGISYDIDFDASVDGNVGDVVEQKPKAFTSIDDCNELKIVVKAGTYKIKFDANGHNVEVPEDIEVTTGDKAKSFKSLSDISKDPKDGNSYLFLGWFTSATGGSEVDDSLDVSGNTTVYAHWEKVCVHEWASSDDPDGWVIKTKATCTTAGSKTRKCTKCDKEETVEIPALGHDYVETSRTDSTCKDKGSVSYKCSRCDDTYTEELSLADHDWEETIEATCDNAGELTCSVCGATEEIPQLVDECSVEPEE